MRCYPLLRSDKLHSMLRVGDLLVTTIPSSLCRSPRYLVHSFTSASTSCSAAVSEVFLSLETPNPFVQMYPVWLYASFVTSVYSNSLFATLNARHRLRHDGSSAEPSSMSLSMPMSLNRIRTRPGGTSLGSNKVRFVPSWRLSTCGLLIAFSMLFQHSIIYCHFRYVFGWPNTCCAERRRKLLSRLIRQRSTRGTRS